MNINDMIQVVKEVIVDSEEVAITASSVAREAAIKSGFVSPLYKSIAEMALKEMYGSWL